MAPTVKFASNEPFTNHAKMILRSAAREVWSEPVQMERAEPGEGVIGFGVDSGIRSLAPSQITSFPGAKSALVAAFFALESDLPLTPWPDADPETILYLDIESHGVEHRWDRTPPEFFRLGQYAWGPTGEVHLTTDYDEVLSVIRRAHGVIAHNGHSFDFSVLLGDEALAMAMADKLFDTMVFANLAFPAPFVFVDRNGRKSVMEMAGVKKVVPHTLKWLGLDNLCFQFGTPGKIGDLKELAKKYGGFGSIPVDDPEFVEYAIQDIVALQDLTTQLLRVKTPDEYDWREQRAIAINAQMSRNGFRVDVTAAQKRVDELEERKATILAELSRDYDFPTEGKAPWSTKVGKTAIFTALKDRGIIPTEIEGWPMGKTGPSLAGSVLIEFCKDTEAEALSVALAALAGQRPLAKQALDNVHSDGLVHPEITSMQRSGRMSVTNPSLATWSAHGPKAVEKSYFIPDPGCKLVEFDMSNADARAVAAMSGDTAFVKRFEPGIDAHETVGRFVFGDETYDSNPKVYRQAAKSAAHAWNYGAGSKRIAATVRVDLEDAKKFCDYMETTYRDVLAWQNRVRNDANRGYTTNKWGREMVVEIDRAYSQSPALQGQSSTREALFDALFKMWEYDRRLLSWLKITVHDAVVFSIPEEHLDWAVPAVVECMTFEWNGVEFPANQGQPADNWYLANHE